MAISQCLGTCEDGSPCSSRALAPPRKSFKLQTPKSRGESLPDRCLRHAIQMEDYQASCTPASSSKAAPSATKARTTSSRKGASGSSSKTASSSLSITTTPATRETATSFSRMLRPSSTRPAPSSIIEIDSEETTTDCDIEAEEYNRPLHEAASEPDESRKYGWIERRVKHGASKSLTPSSQSLVHAIVLRDSVQSSSASASNNYSTNKIYDGGYVSPKNKKASTNDDTDPIPSCPCKSTPHSNFSDMHGTSLATQIHQLRRSVRQNAEDMRTIMLKVEALEVKVERKKRRKAKKSMVEA